MFLVFGVLKDVLKEQSAAHQSRRCRVRLARLNRLVRPSATALFWARIWELGTRPIQDRNAR